MERKAVEREIFSNYYDNVLFEDTKDDLFNFYPEPQWITKNDIPDDRVYDEYCAILNSHFDDFKSKLDQFFRWSTHIALGCNELLDGTYHDGKMIYSSEDLFSMVDDCACVRFYDVNGHLFVEGTYYDGDKRIEVRQLTEEGRWYVECHPYLEEETLFKRLFTCSRYSHLPHFSHIMYGCPKVEYESSVKAKKKKACA